MLTNRSVEALTKAFMPREEEGRQTFELVRLDFEDLNEYQHWSKKEIEPALRTYAKPCLPIAQRTSASSSRSTDELCKGEAPPECKLPEELVADYANPPPETMAPDHSLDHAVKQSSLQKTLPVTPSK